MSARSTGSQPVHRLRACAPEPVLQSLCSIVHNALMKCVRCHADIDKSYMACPHCGEAITDFLRRYLDQPIDGKYEILGRLGAGGMGEVFKVRHTYLGALRVIKVIRPQIANSKDAADRFLREAQLATKVHHPNVATLHDFSALPDGAHYMVWEYIEGENVAQRLRARGTLPARTAVRIAIQALEGLDAVHRAGIVHRDISPENLMLTADGVKIIDLGVAKAEEVDGGTKTGIFVGKLRYASPEQLGFLGEGERIDGRADLYSLALVLYEMLAGRPPFEAKSPHEYLLLHSRETQPRPLDLKPDLPGGAELQSVLQRALQNDRAKRFATAAEFAAALEKVEKTLPDPRDTQTLAVPFDPERTMRVADTLHSPTIHETTAPGTTRPVVGSQVSGVRSTAGATAAELTAEAAQAAETIRTPLPQAQVPVRRSIAPLLTVVVIIFIIVAVGIFVIVRRGQPPATAAAPTPPPAAARTATTQTATTAQSTVEVVPSVTTSSAAASPEKPPATTAATATLASPKKVAEKRAPVKETEPSDSHPTSAPASVPTYVDGLGDSSGNNAAMRQLQDQLAGVRRVALRGGEADLLKQLTASIKGRITIADDADVVIDFSGRVERLGFGRKKRSATVTVSKHGRAVFRYELAPEEYRVGDNPAEAFARVLSDALGR
jgi:eukaryotic-like serine/threonine-protein kinase